jgi:hypothetical protein
VSGDRDAALIQWLYGDGNREGAWARRRARGEKVDSVAEAFRAGWAARERASAEASKQLGLLDGKHEDP